MMIIEGRMSAASAQLLRRPTRLADALRKEKPFHATVRHRHPQPAQAMRCLANPRMEPTRPSSRAIMSPWRAAHLAR